VAIQVQTDVTSRQIDHDFLFVCNTSYPCISNRFEVVNVVLLISDDVLTKSSARERTKAKMKSTFDSPTSSLCRWFVGICLVPTVQKLFHCVDLAGNFPLSVKKGFLGVFHP
jgi:hypothetical protein